MKRVLNCFDPISNWIVYFFAGCISISFSVIACIQRQSCSGRFIFLHLSTLLRSDLPGSHVATKLVLFWVRALQSFFFTFFFHGVCKPCNEPETSWDWTHKYQKTALLFITCFLYWTFLYLLSLIGIFFPLFVCFDILWQLATTHERDRDANSSRQNDFTWCVFLLGKQVELLLSRSLLPQKA